MNRILDRKGLADLDDGRVDLPLSSEEAMEELAQARNKLFNYSDRQLLRLLEQFSHTEKVQAELKRRGVDLSVRHLARLLLQEREKDTSA